MFFDAHQSWASRIRSHLGLFLSLLVILAARREADDARLWALFRPLGLQLDPKAKEPAFALPHGA